MSLRSHAEQVAYEEASFLEVGHPCFVPQDNSAEIAEAMDKLRDDPFAPALARIALAGRPIVGDRTLRFVDQDAYNAIYDGYILARERLDDIATLAAQCRGLSRDDLPTLGELIDELGREIPQPQSYWTDGEQSIEVRYRDGSSEIGTINTVGRDRDPEDRRSDIVAFRVLS